MTANGTGVRLDAGAVAHAFVDAVARRDRTAMAGVLAEDVRLRALIPRGVCEAQGVVSAVDTVHGWFGPLDEVSSLGSETTVVGDRVGFAYRLRLVREGEHMVVEQRGFARIAGGCIEALDLVCSGFRPVEGGDGGNRPVPAHRDTVHDAAPVVGTPEHTLDARGATCATLTPMIAAALRAVPGGAVLTVHTDDPAAPDGIRSWVRLTGNDLVGVDEAAGGAICHIRRR